MRATFSSAAHGKTLVQKLRDELDRIIDCLMAPDGKPDKPSSWCPPEYSEDVGLATEWMEFGELRGQAQGLAFAIATIENSYIMDIAGVTNAAMLRWEERHGQGGEVHSDSSEQPVVHGSDVQPGAGQDHGSGDEG